MVGDAMFCTEMQSLLYCVVLTLMALTSPMAVVRVLMILCKVPYYMLKSVASMFARARRILLRTPNPHYQY